MDATFRAIADPSRRTILDLLAEGERSVTQLLEHFDFSQPALSKHLRVLRDAGLVTARSASRRRLYGLRAEGLRSVAEWVRHYEQFWTERLDALGAVLDAEAGQ
ncbi:ArsR/SmtB family transcription factor [Engelhardtia mirabilis]|uniref:Transcriptional repressor SdpR n=1 Tax=Engelhardtia mirabilis TaxID=2528011 RepID=A0A518BFD7_9BACT|nr:Transcriptional repressor SdpR [Planctomycetes bacterium Pla133]QDV00023.1 Transcriptional repressor SdpR [Planctomycetes bacterium Pla86]